MKLTLTICLLIFAAFVGLPIVTRAMLQPAEVEGVLVTITVNAGGNLQAALNFAQPGDIVELEAGASWDGPFTLPNNGSTATSRTRVRSSKYVLLPNGRIGSNVPSDTLAGSANLARIRTLGTQGEGGYGAAFQTAAGAGGWVLEGLEITDNGPHAAVVHMLLDFGVSAPGAHDILVDRCWLHQKETGTNYNRSVQRAIWAEGRNITLSRSYVYLIGYYYPELSGVPNYQLDTTSFLSVTGPGPLTLEDNFISVWWNGFFLGGGDTGPAHTAILSNASTAAATFSNTTGLTAGVVLRLGMSGTGTWDNSTKILTRTSGVVLDSGDGGNIAQGAGTAIVLTPSGGGTSSVNTTIRGTINGNIIPIGGNNESVGNSGNYDFVVYQTARISSVVGAVVNYVPVGPDTLRHPPDAAAWCVGDEGLITDVVVHRNTFYVDPAFASDVFLKKGYSPKGAFEVKNVKRLTVDANYWFGYPSSLAVYAVQGGTAPWTTTDNVVIINNWYAPEVGHAGSTGSALILNEGSYLHAITPSTSWRVENNLFRNMRSLAQVNGAHNALIRHNTAINDQPTVVGYNAFVAGVGVSNNWNFRDNIGVYVSYGMSPYAGSFAPTWPGGIFLKNVMVDSTTQGFSTNQWGTDSILSPIPTTVSAIGFVDPANGNFRLAPTSPYKGKASDGKDPGADMDQLLAALGATLPPPTPTPTPAPTPSPTATPTPAPTPSPTPLPTPLASPTPTPLTADWPFPPKLVDQQILKEKTRQNGWRNCYIWNMRLWCERP